MKNNLIKTAAWYNPYSAILENGEAYELNKIIIYNENGILSASHGGWFCENNNYIGDCYIQPIKRKLKIDLSKKENFIIKDDNYTWGTEKRYILYIYYKNINYKFIGIKLDSYFLTINYTIFDEYNLQETVGKRSTQSDDLIYNNSDINNISKIITTYEIQKNGDEVIKKLNDIKKVIKKYNEIKENEKQLTELDYKKLVYNNECLKQIENNLKLKRS